MYSGDKLIPERFAACKRVPKIPNSGNPRDYASLYIEKFHNNTDGSNDDILKEFKNITKDMLQELMKFQQRAKDDNNARSRRRLVFGLREVARGIRAQKIKMIIMAHNLDGYDAINEKLSEIITLSKENDIPVLFELNKRQLGRAINKTIKVSVVGVQNADGAYEQFKKLKKVYDKRF